MKDYKEKYEMALETVQEILSSGSDSIKMSRLELRLQPVSPELKESEDEKIRNTLIDYFKVGAENNEQTGGIADKDILAWLEKQGEPTEINPSEFDSRLNRLLKQFESLPKEELASSLSFYLNVVHNDGTYKEEKQGEQKPFDYENATIVQKDFAPKQSEKPRYSIGDVLCDKSCTTLDKNAQPNFEIVDIRNGMYICDKGSFPISQQDEYELVAKKIEQKKIEREDEEYNGEDYGIDSLYHAISILETTLGEVDGYQTDDGILSHKCSITAVKKLYKKKPAEWSEEDENFMHDALSNLTELKDRYGEGYGNAGKCIDWLKSLKERLI